MWAGVTDGTCGERHDDHIVRSNGVQIFLGDGVQCDFPVGTYLKVVYVEDWKWTAHVICPSGVASPDAGATNASASTATRMRARGLNATSVSGVEDDL